MKKLIEDIKNGEYDEWAKGYIEDLNSPNEVRECDMRLNEVLDPIIDFLTCRIIEEEEKGCPHSFTEVGTAEICPTCHEIIDFKVE